MPIITINHPKPLRNEDAGIFSASLPPINIPAIANTVKERSIVQSYSNCFRLNKKPNSELMAMINNDVPIAVFIGV